MTFNADDKVLLKSNDDRPKGAHALGLGTDQPLAPMFVTSILQAWGSWLREGRRSRGVRQGAMNGQLLVCQFFEQALQGEKLCLTLPRMWSRFRVVRCIGSG